MSSEANSTDTQSDRQNRNLQSAGLMLLAVALYSLIPLAVEYTGGSGNPFLFNMGWRSGIAAGFAVFLAVRYRRLFFNWAAWKVIVQEAKSWKLLAVIAAYFDIALFAMSIRFVDVSISTMVAEVSPIFLIVIIWFSYRKVQSGGNKATYRKITPALLQLMLLALLGFTFVVLSQTGSVTLFTDSTNWVVLLGIALALGSALIAALNGFSFRWGTDLGQRLNDELPEEAIRNISDQSISLFGVVVAGLIANLVVVPFNLAIGISTGESISGKVLMFSVIGGALTYPIAGIAWRKANLITHNLGINAIGYFRPVLSLIWLVPFSYIDVSNVSYLIIGAAAIVSANLLINFEAERLLGFKSLVISLWMCGTVVYLREPGTWSWAKQSEGYFDVLALLATVFALILSFRMARLSGRIQEEDNRGFELFEKLAELERQDIKVREAGLAECVLTINREEGRELEAAYNKARRVLNAALAQAEGAVRERLVDAVVELNRLAYSRQRGTNFGEICALFILAGLVVGIALLSRPAEAEGLTGFLIELFAMLFPAVILFLLFNIVDLARERGSRILKRDSEHGGRVAFGDTAQAGATGESSNRRTVEQWISVGVGVALIVAYAGLFLHKWGLWEQIASAVTGLPVTP